MKEKDNYKDSSSLAKSLAQAFWEEYVQTHCLVHPHPPVLQYFNPSSISPITLL